MKGILRVLRHCILFSKVKIVIVNKDSLAKSN